MADAAPAVPALTTPTAATEAGIVMAAAMAAIVKIRRILLSF
jgi:hypothetical protein